MAAQPVPAGPARSAAAADRGGGGSGDSAFEASAFERSLRRGAPERWIGGRRRTLVAVALLGCLAVVSLARWLASTPQIEAHWATDAANQLVLQGSDTPALQTVRGRALIAIGTAPGAARGTGAAAGGQQRPVAGGAPATVNDAAGAAGGAHQQPVDGLLLHRSPRWQVDDAARAAQIGQQAALAAAMAQGSVRLHFDDGQIVDVPVARRGYAGLGLLFWPLAGLALVLLLAAAVVMLARPEPRNLPFLAMAVCQSVNLLLIAIENSPGLGVPALVVAGDLPLRAALDMASGAAAVHGFALHPRRLPRAGGIAVLAWAVLPLWLLLGAALLPHVWWWAQAACIGLAIAALRVIGRSHRIDPNPYALAMRRLTWLALATLVLVTAAVAIAAQLPEVAPGVTAGATIAWYLFLASLLLLTPFLAHTRQLVREFALLAGISTVATSLDLLFVAFFSLEPFTSLALAVFIALGLYGGARQWLLNHLVGTRVPTTERTFDQLYRAARAVQAQPAKHPQLLAQLLRDLFEPLEVMRVDRVPLRARIVASGSALVVPVRGADEEAALALVLRHAHRGQRLFTVDDARLADRVADQLRRAVAYDQAVERGRHEERQRIAQDLHDDIGARLLTLMYQAQTPEMEDYIRYTLQDLKTLTRGLAAAEHRMSHAAAEWKADLTQRLTAARATLDWSCVHDRDLKLTVVQWSALTRVLRELVSNALYHGHAARVEVALVLEGPLLTLRVADDGSGRAPQQWAHGLGLGGVRKRIKLLGGEVAWAENGDRGIVCTVRVARFGPRDETGAA